MSGGLGDLIRLRQQIFDTPHLIHPAKARVIIDALSDRLNITPAPVSPGDDEAVAQGVGRMSGLRPLARTFGVLTDDAIDVENQPHSAPYRVVNRAAIIDIAGTLVPKTGGLYPSSGLTGYNAIGTRLRTAVRDHRVRGIVLDIDSPGGRVDGLWDLADEIEAAASMKPVMAVATSWATSAAYALMAAAGTAIAPPDGTVGSIGVLVVHGDHSDGGDSPRIARQQVAITMIHAGAHKVDGNPFEPLSEEVRDRLQADVDDTYDTFVAAVARRRGMTEQAVRATEARTFNGHEAAALGLIDGVMSPKAAFRAFTESLEDGASVFVPARASRAARAASPAAPTAEPSKEDTMAKTETGAAPTATAPEITTTADLAAAHPKLVAEIREAAAAEAAKASAEAAAKAAEEAVAADRQRAADIRANCPKGLEALAESCVADGSTVDQFNAKALAAVRDQGAAWSANAATDAKEADTKATAVQLVDPPRSAGTPAADDATGLAAAARSYQAEEAAAGRTISVAAAMEHVLKTCAAA